MKAQTIKWLQWHLNEIANNLVGREMEAENIKAYENERKEIEKCIEWVKKGITTAPAASSGEKG